VVVGAVASAAGAVVSGEAVDDALAVVLVGAV